MVNTKSIIYFILITFFLLVSTALVVNAQQVKENDEMYNQPKSINIVSEQTYDEKMEFFSNYLMFNLIQLNTNRTDEELQSLYDNTSYGVIKVSINHLKSAIYYFNNMKFFIEKQYDFDVLAASNEPISPFDEKEYIDPLANIKYQISHYEELYPRYIIILHNSLLFHTNGSYQMLNTDQWYDTKDEKALGVARKYMQNLEMDEDMAKFISSKTKHSLHNLADTYLEDSEKLKNEWLIGDTRHIESFNFYTNEVSLSAILAGLDFETKYQSFFTSPLSQSSQESKKREEFYLTTLQKINILK